MLSAFAGSADKHRRSVCPSVACVSVCSYSRRVQIVCRNVCQCALSAMQLLRRQNTIADFLSTKTVSTLCVVPGRSFFPPGARCRDRGRRPRRRRGNACCCRRSRRPRTPGCSALRPPPSCDGSTWRRCGATSPARWSVTGKIEET